MKKIFYILFLSSLVSCTQTTESTYLWEDLKVSGEFLFEGPNSLQGQIGSPIEQIAKSKNIDASKIKAIYIDKCLVGFSSEDLRSDVENMLVQLVSEKLNLVSVATINGIPKSGPISLSTSEEQDVLAYLQDPKTTLVLDANIKRDMDEMSCNITFDLKILYEN